MTREKSNIFVANFLTEVSRAKYSGTFKLQLFMWVMLEFVLCNVILLPTYEDGTEKLGKKYTSYLLTYEDGKI